MSQKILGNIPYGLLFILSAPAGTGKTTLAHMLAKEFPCVALSVSCTTRPAREGEIDGKDYYFITKEKFQELIEKGDFLEYAEVFGHLYGTLKQEVLGKRAKGFHVVLVIDTQGALQIKNKLDPICMFILPPSFTELKKRLKERNTENSEEISYRFSWAQQEMEMIKFYDYCIINENLEIAYQVLRSILIAEEHRSRSS